MSIIYDETSLPLSYNYQSIGAARRVGLATRDYMKPRTVESLDTTINYFASL